MILSREYCMKCGMNLKCQKCGGTGKIEEVVTKYIQVGTCLCSFGSFGSLGSIFDNYCRTCGKQLRQEIKTTIENKCLYCNGTGRISHYTCTGKC